MGWVTSGLDDLPPVHVRPGSALAAPTAADRRRLARALARPEADYAAALEALGLAGVEPLLEVDCGPAVWSACAAVGGGEVHAVDDRPGALRLARAFHAANGRRVHLSHAPPWRLPFLAERFQGAIVHGLPPRRDAWAELARVLAPGGLLCVVLGGGALGVGETVGRAVRGCATRLRARIDGGRAPRQQGLSPIDARRVVGRLVLRFRACARGAAPYVRPADAPERRRAERLAAELHARPPTVERPAGPLPATVREVGPRTYDLARLGRARAALAGVDEEAALDRLVDLVARGATGASERAARVVEFTQGALYHDPLEQPPLDLDVLELLWLGEGRCGHAARVVADLLRRVGLDARLRQLRAHVVAEVFVDGAWRLADADAFKAGVIPRDPEDGGLLRLAALERDPRWIDQYPVTGWWVRPGTPYTTNAAGHPVRGYVDVGPPEARGYPSATFAPWTAPGPPPPRPPALTPVTVPLAAPATVELRWTPDPDGPRPGRYRLHVGSPRGWTWSRARYHALPRRTGSEVFSCLTESTSQAVLISRPGTYAWSVTALPPAGPAADAAHHWESDEGSLHVHG